MTSSICGREDVINVWRNKGWISWKAACVFVCLKLYTVKISIKIEQTSIVGMCRMSHSLSVLLLYILCVCRSYTCGRNHCIVIYLKFVLCRYGNEIENIVTGKWIWKGLKSYWWISHEMWHSMLNVLVLCIFL